MTPVTPRPAVLDEIARFTVGRLADQKRALPPEKLLSEGTRRPQPFAAAFAQGAGPHVIAEIKRSSPSEGKIAPDADPVEIAGQYLAAGATALSVLTEPGFFGGDVEFLARIRKAHPGARLLMKDFVLDEYQLAQARYFGADAILLIVAMLDPDALVRLYRAARALGLETLVEVHDEAELEAASGLGATLIGVNNRNLKTMQVDLATSERLAPRAPRGATLISESGLGTRADLERLSSKGFHGFLIGTSFMRTGKPGAALAKLLAGSLA
jgi:indole-3-glycerol phosphate synthase